MGQQKIIKCAILYTEFLLTWFSAFLQVSHFLKNFNTMKMIRGCSGSRNSFLAVILSQIGIYFLVVRWWQFQQEMEDGGWFLKPLFLLLFKYTMGPNYKVGFDFLVQCKLDELKKMKKVYEHNKKLISKCQLISKAIYGRLTSPKNKQTYLIGLIFYSSRQANQIRSFTFLGESTARQSTFRFYLRLELAAHSGQIIKWDLTF